MIKLMKYHLYTCQSIIKVPLSIKMYHWTFRYYDINGYKSKLLLYESRFLIDSSVGSQFLIKCSESDQMLMT